MHAYDVPRRPAFQPVPPAGSPLRPGREVPAPRPAQEPHGAPSATPIYDALYAEYVKSFRTLPGDRSGEDDLGFTAFARIPHRTGSPGGHRAGTFSSSYSAYSAGASSARGGSGQPSPWQRVGQLGQLGQGRQAAQPVQGGTQHGAGAQHGTGMRHVPAALPPTPRSGL
ncbi:hypothetical protein [Streptomyces sp. NPDC059378]|uniref:hypothetical protein n=1 Tax=Streptomyces sp. NPDC059378 TaxID=3346815 RepID=UPI0036A80060